MKQAAKVDETGSIQLQLKDGSPAGWGQAHDLGEGFSPGEMVPPALPAWVEQGHLVPGGGIPAHRFGMFAIVAPLAGIGQVLLSGRATQDGCQDMVHRK